MVQAIGKTESDPERLPDTKLRAVTVFAAKGDSRCFGCVTEARTSLAAPSVVGRPLVVSGMEGQPPATASWMRCSTFVSWSPGPEDACGYGTQIGTGTVREHHWSLRWGRGPRRLHRGMDPRWRPRAGQTSAGENGQSGMKVGSCRRPMTGFKVGRGRSVALISRR